jgi:hypothetical protein
MELEKEIMDIDTLYYLNDEVLEKMNDYYFQKKEYDDKLKKNKKKDRSYKPKCIFCNKSGGTIFKTEVNIGSRVLTAKCGNKVDPCSNEIIINTGRIELFSEKITLLKNNIKELKKKIIYYKNDLLFGYIDKISPIFDELKFDIEKNTLQLHYIQEHYIDRVENPEDYDKLIELEKSIYENINEIKINQNDPDNVSGVIEIYRESLLPSLNKILHLKYFEPDVIYEEDENCFRLLETPKKYKTICNEFSETPISEIVNLQKVKKVKKPTLKPKLEEDVPEINLSIVDKSVDKSVDQDLEEDLEKEEEPEEDEIKFVPFKKISFEKERSVEDPEIDELDDMPELEEVDFDAVDVE